MAQIRDYLIQDKFVNLQVKMPEELLKEVKTELKKDRIDWRTFLTACFKAYLDSRKETQSSELGVQNLG